MTLEKELNLWRGECLDTMHYVISGNNRNAWSEIKDSYKVAIEQHTIEYLNNREELLPLFYKLRLIK